MQTVYKNNKPVRSLSIELFGLVIPKINIAIVSNIFPKFFIYLLRFVENNVLKIPDVIPKS